MIRTFLIKNHRYNNEVVGKLYINEETEQFKIEVNKDCVHGDYFINLWRDRKRFLIEGEEARAWIQRRLMPPNRQGLQGILKDLGLKEYNIVKLLDITEGNCVMDYLHFEEIK